MTDSKTKCRVCGEFLTTEFYEDGDPRICEKCWKCPKCGVGASVNGKDNGIVIEEENTVLCHPCDFAWTFKGFENALVKKTNLVPCPTCHGKGTVPGSNKTEKKKTKEKP